MTPLRRKWGIYLCRCGLPEPFDAAPLEAAGAVVDIAADGSALPAFAGRLRTTFADRVLFSCGCTSEAQLEAECDAVGIAPEIHLLDLSGLRKVHTPEEARRKALGLVISIVAGLDRREPSEQHLLAVSNRVAVFTDRPEGLELARALPADTTRLVFLEGDREAFGGAQRGVNWGRPKHVQGRLGAFSVEVSPVAGSDFNGVQRIEADQVVVLGERAAVLQGRTGVHRILAADNGTSDAVSRTVEAIGELTGTFNKPELVRYDAAVCAGGAADLEACGRCIPACPYDAIDRDLENRLRIKVDQLACEGCGACTSACPTSALRFTEPSPDELFARIAGLVSPDAMADSAAPAVVFHCEQQGRALLDWATENGAAYSGRVMPLEVPCLRYVSESAMLTALKEGAAGVGLLGCETCPNGERELLLQKIEVARQIAQAFEMDPERVRLLPVRETDRAEGLQALQAFIESLPEAGVPVKGRPLRATGNRDALAGAIESLISSTGREPGPVAVHPGQPYAYAEVRSEGCTLCRACATVCPTHAFAYDVDAQRLSFKHIACVTCGLCERVCPENVIKLRHELRLARASLDYATVAEDEMVRCARCEKPYINRRALDSIEAKLKAAQGMGPVFTGNRANLLKMCPDCRAGAAMLEIDGGWQP